MNTVRMTAVRNTWRLRDVVEEQRVAFSNSSQYASFVFVETGLGFKLSRLGQYICLVLKTAFDLKRLKIKPCEHVF